MRVRTLKAVNNFSIAAAVSSMLVCAGTAFAGETGPRQFSPSPAGGTQADDALAAKANAQCLALYGPGYMAMGGSSTCIKIGGRVGVTVGGGSGWKQNRVIAPSKGVGAPAFGEVMPIVRAPSSYASGPVGHIVVNHGGRGFGSEADATVYLDAKTQTEMGVLTTHLSVTGVKSTGGLRGPDYTR